MADTTHDRVTASERVGRIWPMVLGTLALAAFSVGCASGGGLSREEAFAQVDAIASLDGQLSAATSEGLDLLAPKGAEAAQASLDQAISKAESGDLIEAKKLADQGLARLDQAKEEAKQSSEVLRAALEQRARAVEAGAPDLLPDRFEKLDGQLRSVAKLVEKGEIESAKDATPELIKGYSKLELDSLKVDATELARTAIESARKSGAERYAKDTFARAQRELDVAMGILETDRSRTTEANVHARRAADLAMRSQHVGELVKEFERRGYNSEAIVLWYQEQIEKVVSPMGDEPSFTEPNHETIAELRAEVAQLVADNEEAAAALLMAAERIEQLELTYTLSETEQREVEARYDRIQSLFNENEAVVYRQGRNVLIDAYGFDFPVGQSEIESSNFPLLRKIATAIETFSDPDVVVSGHTDSSGDDALNQKLSDERAAKVGNFLVEVAGIQRDRVKTKGFGKTKPVASNETAAGRARNRRIEILIVNR